MFLMNVSCSPYDNTYVGYVKFRKLRTLKLGVCKLYVVNIHPVGFVTLFYLYNNGI